jgi:hypothetical protein
MPSNFNGVVKMCVAAKSAGMSL